MMPLVYSILFLFAGTVVFYGIIFYPFSEGKDPFIRIIGHLPKKEMLLKIYTTFKLYQNHKLALFATLFISIVIHISVTFAFFMITGAIGISNLKIATQMFIMPIGLITIAIPIAPGGIGVGHVAFDRLYALVGISGGADIFNLFIIIQLVVNLVGGLIYFFYSSDYKIPKADDISV